MAEPIRIEFDPKAAKRLAQEGPVTYQKEMKRAMTAGVEILRGEIINRTPVNTGKLRQSIGTDVRIVGATRLIGEVATPLVYGAPVEYGREPGKMPPVDAIEYWVRRTGIDKSDSSRSTAYVIARAIGRKGTKGAFMFTEGTRAAISRVQKQFDDAMKRIKQILSR